MSDDNKIKEGFVIQNMLVCQQLSYGALNLNTTEEDCVHCHIEHDMGKSIPHCDLYKSLERPPCQNCKSFKLRPLRKYDDCEGDFDDD